MTVLHPKVKAGGQAAAAVTVIVAVAALFGLNVTHDTQDTLIAITAAVLPVVAGYAKRAS